MTRRLDSDPSPTRGDRLLIALIVVASGTFIAAVLWLLLGSR
jgi:hypothetical protein